jgi:three-Cys-motif partner protein
MAVKNGTSLEDHSKAKVELYERYLSIYLNIMSRTDYIQRIHLFDLFAGEGVYQNNQKGSPLITIQTIKNHYFSNNKTCPNLDVYFNDDGQSEIDRGKSKIERIQSYVEKEFMPNNVKPHYDKIPYSSIVASVKDILAKMTSAERALLFIDPWGYKDIDPSELRALLQNRRTEIILFLPIYHMYRFANKALDEGDKFPGGKPLEKFLTVLFNGSRPKTGSSSEFIDSLSDQFKSFLNIDYTDTFTIERDKGNFFCLFFFTPNKVGYRKMLEAKWNFDEENGKGFSIENNSGQTGLFNVVETNNYFSKVAKLLGARTDITNRKLFDFGLENRHLPKHTTMVLDALKREGKLDVMSLDDKQVRGFYIDNEERLVSIKLK